MKLLLLLALLPSIVLANSCDYKNLITEADSPFDKIPVYDQGRVNICYAYTAAQLLDYELIKDGLSSRSIHPAWLALKDAISVNKSEISLGSTRRALEALFNDYNCHYDVVAKEIGKWAYKANVNETEILNFLESFTNQYKKTGSLHVAFKDALKANEANCPPHATWNNLIPQLEEIAAFTTTQIMSKLLLPKCDEFKVKIPAKRVRMENNKGPQFSSDILKHLDKKNSPVEVTYCSNFWKDPTYSGRISVPELDFKSDCFQHSSLVVGKRELNNSCQVLIRNTWGNGWNKENEKWTCLCKHKSTGKYVDNCTMSTHNNGQYSVEACWVGEALLNNNSFSSVILQEESNLH